MAKKLLSQFLDENGNEILYSGALVVDAASGVSFESHVADASVHLTQAAVDAAVNALKDGDIMTVQDSLAALQTAVDTFLKGEADGGTIDRLVELVAAINENKGSIDALVSDHVAKDDIVNDLTTGGVDKVLSAEQGKALKALLDGLSGSSHAHANKTVLDGVGEDGSGDLTYNGKTLGETGMAFVTSAEESPVFTGKVRMVLADYESPAEV